MIEPITGVRDTIRTGRATRADDDDPDRDVADHAVMWSAK
jgi:hypothetical protein